MADGYITITFVRVTRGGKAELVSALTHRRNAWMKEDEGVHWIHGNRVEDEAGQALLAAYALAWEGNDDV